MNTKTRTGSFTFSNLLTIAFIVLKLIGIIQWSWVWVLSPMWIGLILNFLIAFLCAFLTKDEVNR